MENGNGRQARDAAFDGLSEWIPAAMARLNIPGVVVAVLERDEERVAGFGVTNVDYPLPVDGDTLFQIGSISKTVLATVVMRLVERGDLDLDAPIRTYLPDLRLADPDVTARVTLRHLVTHTGGWVGDFFADFGSGDDALTRYVAAMAELPQRLPLGEVFSYNNSGFSLAGRVVEAVTGQTYEAAIQDLIFDPLGMTRSFFFAADAIGYGVAVGHHVADGRPTVARPWALGRGINPAGGIIANARDVLRYARFHLSNGQTPVGAPLLRPESVARMREPLMPAGNYVDAVGIAWLLKDVGGVHLALHSGGTNGQQTFLLLAPERHLALVILTNADSGPVLHREVIAWVLRQYLGVEDSAVVPLSLAEKELAPYAGHYEAVLTDVDISVREGSLVMQVIAKGGFPRRDSPAPASPPPVRLAIIDRDRVVATEPPFNDLRAEFLRDPAGTVVGFRWGSRVHLRQT